VNTEKKQEKKSLWLPIIALALPMTVILILGFIFGGPLLMKLLHAAIKMGVMA